MDTNKKLLCVLLAILFFTMPLGINALTPIERTATTEASVVASDNGYDFVKRNEPVNLLVYTEYADLAVDGEWNNTMVNLLIEYGYTLDYSNMTDHTILSANYLNSYDVLLIVEQENANNTEMDIVAAAWSGFIGDWVLDGGVVICMSYWEDEFASTTRILNGTGLMEIYNPIARTGDFATITDSNDPLAFGVNAFNLPNGGLGFDTPSDEIFGTAGQTVVAHRYLGRGHVVMLGFDLYETEPNAIVLLANAVRLTRLAVFDNSHHETYDPYSGYNEFATYIQTNWGFAIATMNSWDETLVGTCQVLVTGSNTGSPLPYSANEVAYVNEFVTAGGGLFMMSDIWWYGNSTDPLLAEFGFERNQTGAFANDIDDNEGTPGQPIYNATNIAKHAITFHVSEVQMFGSTAFTTIPANARPLIWTDNDGTAQWSLGGDASGYTIAASMLHGNGRIVAVADGDFLCDNDNDGTPDGSQDFYDLDNEYFVRGIMNWLAAAGLPEKSVLYDNSHVPALGLYDLDDFSQFLSLNGFNFLWMDEYEEGLVNQADVLILPDGNENLTSGQISNILQFVNRGGGLFVLADQLTYCQQVNPLVAEFGMQYNDTGGAIYESDDYINAHTYPIFDGDNIADNPIMTGVERIELDLNGGFATVGTGIALLSTDTDGTATWTAGGIANGVPVFAAATYGLGRVVAIADYNLPAAGDYDGDNYINLYDSDNDVFLANAFFWFIQNRAPIVEVVFPNGGELLNSTQFVEWNALDPNRDELTFEVLVSDNNGSDWSSLASGLTGLTYEWNTTLHDDGTSYMIRVVASDGMLTAYDDSDNPFELDNFVGGPSFILDPMLLAIIGGAIVVVLIIIVVLSKKGGGGKK